jgi:hypothetical protein
LYSEAITNNSVVLKDQIVQVSFKQMMWRGGLVILGLIAMLIILPWFLNPEYLKTLALQQIQRTFGSHVNVGETSFALFPHPHFLVSDIVVKEQPDSHAVFRAQSMSLELGIGQLLMKKIVVREFLVDRPEIEIRRNPSGEWRFFSHSGEDSQLASLAKFLVMEKFVISGGKIIIIDESPREIVRGFVIEDVGCVSETTYEGSSLSSTFKLTGKLRQAQHFAPFHIQGTLEAMLNAGGPSIGSRPVYFDQATFSGQVKADKLEIHQFGEYVPHGESLSKFPGVLSVESQVKWVQNPQNTQLYLTNIRLSSPSITLGGTANIEVLKDGHQMMGLSMRSSNVDLEMVQRYVPPAWIPDELLPLWEKGQWGGKLDIAEARVISSTREDVKTSVTGTFRLYEGFLTIPDWPAAEHIQGTVVVEPDRIQLAKAQGVYDGIPVEITEGVFLLKESGPWGNVEIQGPVPAEKVVRVVSQLGESSHFNLLEFLKVSQGWGGLRLRFAGNLLESPGLMFQYGEYHPQDLIMDIPGLPHPLAHGHGKITFSRDSTVIESIQGNMGAHPFMVNGTIAHQDKVRFAPLTISAGFEGQDILTFFPTNHVPSELHFMGPLKTSITLTGSARYPKIKGWIDGEGVAIDLPSVLQKQAGQEGMVEFDGQLHPGEIFQLERVELVMLPLRLLGQGSIRYGSDFMWKGRVDSGPVYLGLLPEGIRMLGDVIQSGILEIQLTGNGRGTDWTQWNMKGWLALTEGVVPIRGRPDPISNLFVRLKIDRDQLDLKRMEFHLKKSQAVITGFMNNWKTSPVVSLLMESPKFDIDLLIPKKERSPIRDAIEWIAAHGSLEGSVHVERPSYKTLSGKSLSAAVKIHDHLVTVDKVQTMVEPHGSLGGRFFVHLPEGRPAAMRASFQATDLPFEKILNVLDDEGRLITGNMSIQGMIQGHGRDSRGIVPTLNGNMEVALREGYVQKGTILPRILALLNLPQVLRGKVDLEKTGFPFKKVSTSITIEEGKFSTKNFLLDSSIMKGSAAGEYDLSSDWLKGIAAVSPFGAYSNLLKDIPLFGRIFVGDRKGIATAMFAVSGPLSDPTVEYMPMESLKTGLTGLAQLTIDILKNTLTLPYDLLKEAHDTTLSAPAEEGSSGAGSQ